VGDTADASRPRLLRSVRSGLCPQNKSGNLLQFGVIAATLAEPIICQRIFSLCGPRRPNTRSRALSGRPRRSSNFKFFLGGQFYPMLRTVTQVFPVCFIVRARCIPFTFASVFQTLLDGGCHGRLHFAPTSRNPQRSSRFHEARCNDVRSGIFSGSRRTIAKSGTT
jgi:hypothetical protein